MTSVKSTLMSYGEYLKEQSPVNIVSGVVDLSHVLCFRNVHQYNMYIAYVHKN